LLASVDSLFFVFDLFLADVALVYSHSRRGLRMGECFHPNTSKPLVK
jgi:hypothetical protein